MEGYPLGEPEGVEGQRRYWQGQKGGQQGEAYQSQEPRGRLKGDKVRRVAPLRSACPFMGVKDLRPGGGFCVGKKEMGVDG